MRPAPGSHQAREVHSKSRVCSTWNTRQRGTPPGRPWRHQAVSRQKQCWPSTGLGAGRGGMREVAAGGRPSLCPVPCPRTCVWEHVSCALDDRCCVFMTSYSHTHTPNCFEYREGFDTCLLNEWTSESETRFLAAKGCSGATHRATGGGITQLRNDQQTHQQRTDRGRQGEGERWIGSLRLADAN